MKIIWTLGLGAVFWCIAGLCAKAEEAKMPLAKNPPNVVIDANRKKKTKIQGGDHFDDKTQKVQLEISITNGNLNIKSIEGLTLHYWALAQSIVERRDYLVIDAGTAKVKLDNTQAGREMHVNGTEVTLQLDDTGVARYGEAYKGFVLVLLNEKKEVVAVKATFSSWQDNFERAFKLRKDSWCDINLKPVSKPIY